MPTDDQGRPVEARLRDALATVADTRRADHDWPGVLGLGAQMLGTIETPRSTRRRVPPRLLAAAAIVAFVAIAAAVAFVARDSRGVGSVTTVDLASAADASQASTARTLVTQEYGDGSSLRIEGEVDFERRRLHVRGELGMEAEGTDEVGSDDLPEAIREMVELMASVDEQIVVDDRVYVRSDGAWWDLGTGWESDDGLDLFSPATLLDQVAKLGEIRTIGPDEVRGAATTHYQATDRRSGDRYDVWVDSDGRVVRTIETAHAPEPTEVARTTTDLFDFGASVSIEAPAGAETFDSFAGPGSGTEPATGTEVDLREVASGSERDVAWILSTGELADGRRCVQVDTDPALDGEVVDLAADGSRSTSYDVPAGSATSPSCGPTSFDVTGSAVLLTVGGKDGDVHYLAGLVAEDSEVTLTFPDGREEQLVSHDGAFIVTFSGDDWPTEVDSANASCQLQGDATISGSDQVC